MTWTERHAAASATLPDLVAVYESRTGRVALLLRHTIVPLAEERSAWVVATGRAADAAIATLRAAGLDRPYVIMQWSSFAEVANILGTWTCRYLGDAGRRDQVAAVVERFLADRRWIDETGGRRPDLPALAAADGGVRPVPARLGQWYDDMSACWLSAQPPVRRSMILRTHRWIAERLLGALAQGRPAPLGDLEPGGALVRALVEAVPAHERRRWRTWMDLLLADLRRALDWPSSRRDVSWARWLFLIPYSIPTPDRPTRLIA